MANAFIWSAFQYYLKKDEDSYILYSPIKYWKSHHIVNRRFLNGYGLNRKHFHASNAFISLILWSKEKSKLEEIKLSCYDIDKNDTLVYERDVILKKVYSMFSEKYFDKRQFDSDVVHNLCCGLNGHINITGKVRIK